MPRMRSPAFQSQILNPTRQWQSWPVASLGGRDFARKCRAAAGRSALAFRVAVNRPTEKTNLANLLDPGSAERAGASRAELLAAFSDLANNPFFPVACLPSSACVRWL